MMQSLVEIFGNLDFGVIHKVTEEPNIIEFKLHNHDDLYEAVLLLDGDCEFYVEGNTYRLEPNDIIFVRSFEMHRIVCLTDRTYDRIIVHIKSDYFKKHNCDDFLNIFENRQLGTGNRIPKDIAQRNLNNCIQRLCKCGEEKAYDVVEHILFEFLYLLNDCKNFSDNFYVKDERVRDIIMYINNHLSDNLCLDVISKEFFITKHYMCKIFKKFTGYTISQYISYKRLLKAQKFYREGQTLIQASLNAGFNSYANFYKMYLKQFGKSPSKEKIR